MMWISKELFTVFALTFITVRAMEFSGCHLGMMDSFNATDLNGIWYLALGKFHRITIPDLELPHRGYILTPVERKGKPHLHIDAYARQATDPRCVHVDEYCEIIDNHRCQNTNDLGMYIVASNDKYLVMYSGYGIAHRNKNLEIYTRDFSRAMDVTDLSYDLQTTIRSVCGRNAIKSAFYETQYQPGNFIPNCLTDEDRK